MGILTRIKSLIAPPEPFNAVIEGTYHDEWSTLNYKLARLQVPENAAVLNDGTYKYQLHGKTADFKNLQKAAGESSLEAKIEFIGFCNGVVLPYMGGIPCILERPRTVCMKDGRIFVDEHMSTDKLYMDAMTSIMGSAGKIFQDKKFSDLYNKVVIS